MKDKLLRELGDPARSDVLFWAVGIILTALGTCFAAKSGFGVSMVVAPAYVLHLKVSETLSWFTFGVAEYCVQGLLIIIMIIALRGVRLKYLLSFVTTMIYGQVLDFWRRIFGEEVAGSIPSRVAYAAFGILIVALAIAMMFRTCLPQEAYEMFVKEISGHFGLNINRFKWIFDLSCLAAAIILMLAFFHTFSYNMVGIATLVIAFINAPLIALSGKIIDHFYHPDISE